MVRRHLAEQVGEVVVLHLVEHADEAVEVEVFDEPELLGLGKLFEHVGESLVVHRLGELAPLRDRQGAHDGGDVGRVHVAQAGGLGDHRARRFEQARQLVVIDEAIARTPAEGAPLGEADLGDLPPVGTPVGDGAQGDVAHGLVADVLVDQLGADLHLAGSWLERVEVDVPTPQARAVAVELGDTSRVDEDPAALTRCDEAKDARRMPRATWHDDDVLDLADRRATGVEQVQAHHPERVDQLACHAGRLALDPMH